MDRCTLALAAALALAGCESASQPRGEAEAQVDEPAQPEAAQPEPAQPEPAQPEPAQPEQQPGAASPPVDDPATAPSNAPITGIDSAVTSSGLPQHVRFSITHQGAAAATLELRELGLREDGGSAHTLEVRELQLWPEGADAPTSAASGQTLQVPAGGAAELLIYLGSWDGDPRADHFEFEGSFALDGEAITATAVVQRARREPRR